MDSELLTRPTYSELLTRPLEIELPTQPTEFSEKNGKDHELEVNLVPAPSSSDLSETYSLDSRAKKKKSRKKKSVVSIRKMTRQTHLRVTTLILLMAVITETSDAKRRNIVKKSNQIMQNFNGKIADDSV